MSKKERIENLEDHVIRLTEELDEAKYSIRLLLLALEIVNEILLKNKKEKEEEKIKNSIEQDFDIFSWLHADSACDSVNQKKS